MARPIWQYLAALAVLVLVVVVIVVVFRKSGLTAGKEYKWNDLPESILILNGPQHFISKGFLLKNKPPAFDEIVSVNFYVTFSKDKQLITVPVLPGFTKASADSLDTTGAKIER